MSDITKYVKGEMEKSSVRQEVGSSLVKVGAGGAGALVVAGLLPFITFPMLLVFLVLFGGYLYVK